VGFLDFLKKDKWRYVMQGNLNKPVWTTQKDKAFITEGYNRIVWVYSCVGAISSAVSSVPWLLYRKGRGGRLIEVEDHPILTMLNNRANPYMSSKDFIDYWCTYLALEGKFYAEYSNPNAPISMYPLYPHYMYPIPHKTEFIGGYEYRLDTPIMYEAREILWSKFNDPLDVYQGMSPIRALSRTIDTENETVDWNKATLQNSGIPAGLISVQNPSPELSARLEEEWTKRYSGGKNARKPIILNADKAQYMSVGLSPVDMDFLNQRKLNRIEICAALGVPSQIVGDPEGQTYSNYGEAQKAFWENTVISKYLDHILDKLQSDLLPRYADNLVLKYDLSGVGALKENEDKKAERVRKLWIDGLVTRNEGRLALDYEDVKNGDLFYEQVQAAMMGLPVATEQATLPVVEVEEPEQEEPEDMEDGDEEEMSPDELLKKKEPTNFPAIGDDETISLSNSQFELFPLDYAESLRENYPEIWARGGNIQGNDTYRVITRIREEGKSADELTDNDIRIVKMREAWSARHFRDFRLAGVIAQVKWHMVGSRGLDHMKKVIEEAKAKADEKALDMQPDEEKAYWKRIDKERERIILKTRRELTAFFRRQSADMQKAIEGKTPVEVQRSADALIREQSKRMSAILTAMNVATIRQFGQQTYNDLQTEKMMQKSFDPYTPAIKAWIAANIANAVVMIDDTTKREIQKIIDEGIQQGYPVGDEDTPDTIAFLIGKLYLEQIIPNRSEVIARTEVMTAANRGSLDGAEQAQREGAKVLKYWIPTADGDTRDTHREMRNHPAIRLESLFQVGQSRGEFPADAQLSARERINCRCAIGYKRQRDAEGGEG
jgi:HK97 family phage portal protein